MNTLATVVTLTGRAWAVTADGQRRKLKEGDRLRGDEMLVTEPGARVDLDFDNNQMLTFLGEQQQNIGEAIEFAQAELPPSAPRPAAEGRQQPQAQPAQADVEPEGHKFVQLVRINEIIEADGITPLTIARIQEVLRPLGMSLPERVYDLDEWREHRGGDERYEDAPAARHPGLTVELQGAGPDGIYSEAEIGTDGTVPAEVTLDDKVRVGDRLVIKDGKGNILLDRPVTQNDLDNGVTVEVPVVPGDRNVTVEATVTTPRGYTGQDRDDKPVDNLPPDEVTTLPPQDSEDAESISLDLGSYFEDNVDGKDLTYDVTGLPPGLSFDPDTGIITGTIDRSASQGGPDDDGIYKVTVTITDKVGNQTTIDFDWTVTNPEPEARDDRQTIDEDTVATGNVLTGAGNDPGVDGSDSDPDGDDLTVTSFTIGNDPTVYPADGTPVSVEDADGNLIGEITLNENGDYSFTPVPDWNGSVPDIHYTISDGEGGEDEARLSITVAPVNDPVELENIPDPNDPNDPGYPAVNDPTDPNDPARGNANDHVVFESALPGGSDQSSNQADLKVESSFTINAPDGLHGSQGLVLTYTNINGESRTLNLGKKQIEQLGSNNQTVDTQYGKLVLNGHTLNADGTISIDYEYTLERAPEVGGDHVDDRINIAVRDSDAHHPSDTDSKDLVIRIIDDAPVARNDANGIDEDTAVPVTGNVIANGSTGDVADTQGADGARVTGVTAGDQTGGGHVADGGVAGNIIGDYGTLVLNADGSYSYELDNSNLAVQGLHPDDAPLTDVFTYTITDADGDQSTATLTITVNGSNDGVTVTVPDPNDPADPNYPTVNDPADPNDPARGNVNDHVVFESGLAGGSATNADDTRVVSSFTLSALDGLDDTAAITIEVAGNSLTLSKAEVEDLLNNNQSITTEYGELLLNGYTLNADGSITIDYEYTLTSAPDNTGGNGVHTDDTIRITVNDRDTDSDSQDLVIRIIDDAPVARDDANAIDEDETSVSGNVIAGSMTGDVADTEGADGATVTAIVSDNDATSTATTNADGDLVIEGEYGTLTIQPNGEYEYVLNNDNAEVNKLKDGETLTEEFTYTLTDTDGDSDTARLTITINGRTDASPSIVPEDDNGNGAIDGHNTVNESGLAGGSTAGDGSNIVDGTIQISAGDGLGSITIGGQSFTLAELQALSAGSPSAAIAVEGGTLVLTGFTPGTSVGGVPTSGTLQYTYTLTGERTHSTQGNDDVLLNIPLSVTDAGNETVDGTLTIQVVDDVPTAADDTADVAAGTFELVQDGNVLDNDAKGADGARVTGIQHADDASVTSVPGTGNLVIDGAYGKLTIHSDGSYSYQRNPGTEGGVEDVFEYTITDGDGDTSSASLTISIADSAPTVTIPSAGGATTTVHESGLPDGSDNIPDRATTSGSIEFNSADGLGTVSLGGHTLTEIDQTFSTTGPAGSLTARYEYDPVTGKGTIHYSYTLEETTSGDNTSASFPVEITDQDGDAAPSGNLVINIVDDTPTAAPDQATVTEGATLTVDAANGVLENDAAGADGWHDSGNAVVDVTSNNQPSNTASTVGGVLVIQGEYGTLTIAPDGSYTYESRANAVTGDEQDVFTYTVRDADGDETTATLTINISDVTGISRDTTGTVDEAGLPAGSDASSDKETTGGSLNLADGWTVDPSSVGNQSSGIGTLTINADGSYSYELTSRTEDVAGVEETDTFTYTARDQYGNTVINTVTITIIDDVPSVTLTGNALGEVQVDETTLGDSASADFSGAFTHHFGADGDNGDGLVYTLEVDTAATGLLDTETGDPIVLVASPDGLTVTGHVGDDSGPAAFTISVDANGEVTLTQNRPLKHSDPNNHDDVLTLPAGSLKLTATATDGDGDTDSASVDIGGRFSFRDDGPTIGAAPAPGVVDEAYLTTGSGDGTAGLSTETGADLDVDFGSDGQGSLVFSEDQVALRNWLDASGNTDITITGTGTDVLSGTRGGQEIFTVTLTVNASGQASYHFELKGALLHRSHTQDHELTFSYEAVDGDGDRANGTFRVDVKDDEPRTKITIDVDEDDANGPFTTSADATQDNTTISMTAGGPALSGTLNGNDLDYDVDHGTVTVHEDGRITYTPNPDYSNHGSPDKFYVTVTEDDGTSQTIEVTVNVIPVADAPELTVDTSSVTTNEDEAIALGLNAPKTTDDDDQNGSGTAGDNPERLGPITLSGFPAGAQLLDGTVSDSPLHTFDGTGSVTIVISDNVDGPHFNGATGTLTLTTAQYEALKVLPPAESSANFTVDVSVISYEVDESGNPLTTDVNGDPIDGAESTVSVTVNVQAVTDGIDLTIHNGDDNYVDADSTANAVTLPAFDEDGSINLKDYLQITLDETGDGNSGADTDGSEQRWFEVSGLPVGSTVNGTEITSVGQSVRVDIPNDYNGASPSLPDIVIQPPADFSGDLDGVRVTLYAQDRDSDGPNPLGTQISDSVYLNLRINPQGGDVAADDVTTEEDTAVAFLKHVRVTDTGTGNEIITEVEFSLPDGWVLVDKPAGEGTGWAMTGSGTTVDPYIISSLNGTDLKEVLGDFTVLPPAHSSKDEDIVVRVTSTDTNTVGGNSVPHSDWRDLTIKVEVTPKGERVENIGNPDRDTDGNNNPDLTMTPGRDYTTPGEEDEWFMLGQEAGFNLKDGWSNEDGRGVENGGTAGSGSEQTFALLTPNLIAGDGSQADATGSEFQWGPVVGPDGARQFSEVFGGDPIEVPIEYLNTLEFKAAPHFSGMFEIKVQAKTVDYDEDYPGDESRADVQVSGDATLTNILIAPKADTVTATVTARVEGDEDERMPLSIRPKSSDPSESFEVDIDGIPDGATLWYDGVELTSDADTSAWPNISITDNGDGTWKVEFTDFDPSKGAAMEIRAPQDSNEPFDLDIAIRSVDELHIPNPGGTPDPITHRDVSSDYPLTITVAPKGIADEAIIDLIDYDDPITGVDPFTEADVDAAGGVMLSALIVNAELKDNDGSETLTFKISGLPDGFSIEGATFMGGSGTAREWSLTKAQLAGAKLVTPPNFNGSQTFDFYSVTTEDDNHSLTEQHSVELRVSPSPEATINLEASIDEDVSTRLDFSIQHRNGDNDEVLEEVWISAADLAALAALGDLNLTYGQNGPSLAAAAADAGNTSVVLDNGWYKLTGVAIDHVYAQGRENWHGDASFGVHYVIRDPALDSSVSDVSEGFDGTYEVTVNPITDQVTLVDPADISLDSPGNTGITLEIGNTGADYDGSEQLTRIILEHVPEGVVVVGTADYDVDFVGDGTWVLIPSGGSFTGLLTTSIALQVYGRAGELNDHQIRVTVVTEDAGNGAESRASTEVGLTTNFAGGGPDAPAIIERWEQTSFEPTEDVAFNLGQAIDAKIDATGVTNSGFTITLTDLPPGTQVTGMTRTMVNGEEVWSVSGQGGDAELQSLLSSITVTPPLDWNSNKGPFEYNARLTTHTPTGGLAQAELAVDQTVIPVTDHAAISIDMPAVDEGNDLAISINVSNPSDDPDWELIDGNLYLELDESGMSAGGGMLLDASGNPLIPAPDGRYIIENVTPGTPINLTYRPSGPYVSGSISLEASVTGQENGAAGLLETTVSQQGDVNPINNGYDFDVNTSSGDEAPVAADKEHAIRLNITGNGLVDDDGSESITAILLKNLPNDFLVFVGEDAASAIQVEMANNAGGSGTNTWVLEPGADGNLPPYIAILPPKNWNGTLEDLELTVISGEGSRSDRATDTRTFNLEVNPVANGLAINPTPSFGREGEIIGLNLNARFEDLRQAGTTDESVERATVELKGLGEHAAIYIGGNLIMDRVTYDEVNDVYTITGLTQDELDQLGFVQAAGDINNLQVRARTEEYDESTGQPVAGVEPSDWTHGTDDVWAGAPVSTNITAQFGTSGADELLWTGQGILNGRGGDDTVQLRFGESLEGSDLAAHLRNIEMIDLSIEGENRIEGLKVEDVLAMTDDRDTLKIFGDSEDAVSLDDPSAWTHTGEETEEGKTFNVYEGGGATLWVEQGVIID
ncbi:VCBS repeat-containing protein [Halopseudomonas formosensis]|uniref:VCBS repeat-containing protein n=1 Tax=Halopseudomonas formosensis TaxID=1002526 RepID=A0A1I6BVN8_9GAMM|nr:DUF5801 repeats-in-toxin domain-containing protein [Halopseudomonas formosensis]SFQ85008.1 VCBS repeat-containing protein [Halopseudomonas formosensis]